MQQRDLWEPSDELRAQRDESRAQLREELRGWNGEPLRDGEEPSEAYTTGRFNREEWDAGERLAEAFCLGRKYHEQHRVSDEPTLSFLEGYKSRMQELQAEQEEQRAAASRDY